MSFEKFPKIYKKMSMLKTKTLDAECETPAQAVSVCEFCKNTFLQNTTWWLFLTIVMSVVLKGEWANKVVNYDTEIKTYQLELEV